MRTWGLKRRMLGIWMALGSENLSIFFIYLGREENNTFGGFRVVFVGAVSLWVPSSGLLSQVRLQLGCGDMTKETNEWQGFVC